MPSHHFWKFHAFFAIIFNNWGKTVIKLAFLSVSTIWAVKYCAKTWHFQILIFFHFVIIFYSLFSRPLPTRPLFSIVLHNGVKNTHVRKAWFVTWSERRISGLLPLIILNISIPCRWMFRWWIETVTFKASNSSKINLSSI